MSYYAADHARLLIPHNKSDHIQKYSLLNFVRGYNPPIFYMICISAHKLCKLFLALTYMFIFIKLKRQIRVFSQQICPINLGRGGRNRTHVKGFGDPYSTIEPHPFKRKESPFRLNGKYDLDIYQNQSKPNTVM